MNLIVDENIVFATEAFSSLGTAKLVNGRNINRKVIKDADVLIVRSITTVNEELLRGSKVKFVGTATIGTDHVDLNYLSKNNIQFADAKGCNADSVAEYVFTALLKVASEKKIPLREKSIGVVGIGNIGSRVVRIAESFGMKVLKNDPPLEREGIGINYVELDEVLQADIITLHVPMIEVGIDKTLHLLNEANLPQIKNGTILLNTSRGGVVDNSNLLNESNRKELEIVLDVWENEPSIHTKLLTRTKIATPHIAGYSFEGKVNGTKMIYNSLCKFLKSQPNWQPDISMNETNELKLPEGKSLEEKLYKLFSSIYNIDNDDELMRKISNLAQRDQSAYFDSLRKNYPIRREFSNFTVLLRQDELHLRKFLESFRFKIKII